MASSTVISTHVPRRMLLLVFLVVPSRGFDFRRPPTLVTRPATPSTETGSWLPASVKPRVTAFYRNYTGALTKPTRSPPASEREPRTTTWAISDVVLYLRTSSSSPSPPDITAEPDSSSSRGAVTSTSEPNLVNTRDPLETVTSSTVTTEQTAAVGNSNTKSSFEAWSYGASPDQQTNRGGREKEGKRVGGVGSEASICLFKEGPTQTTLEVLALTIIDAVLTVVAVILLLVMWAKQRQRRGRIKHTTKILLILIYLLTCSLILSLSILSWLPSSPLPLTLLPSLNHILIAAHVIRTKSSQLLLATRVICHVPGFTAALLFVVDTAWLGLMVSLSAAIQGCELCERNILSRLCLTDNVTIAVGLLGITAAYFVWQLKKKVLRRTRLHLETRPRTNGHYRAPDREKGMVTTVFIEVDIIEPEVVTSDEELRRALQNSESGSLYPNYKPDHLNDTDKDGVLGSRTWLSVAECSVHLLHQILSCMFVLGIFVTIMF